MQYVTWCKWPTWITLGGSLTTLAREPSSRSVSRPGGVFSAIFDTTVVCSVMTRKGLPVGGRRQSWAKWVEFSSGWVRGWHRLLPEVCLFYSRGCVSPSPFNSRDKGGCIRKRFKHVKWQAHMQGVDTDCTPPDSLEKSSPLSFHFKNQFQCEFSRAFVRVWCL